MFAVPPNTLPGDRPVLLHPARIALQVAADRSRWAHRLRYDPVDRWVGLLEKTDEHEIWLMSWLPGQHTELHDHNGGHGAFTVIQGSLVERVARVGADGRPVELVHALTAGQTRAFGPSYVHEVRNSSPDPAVSIHVFGPRRQGMTEYRQDLLTGPVAKS
ncbi:cysteine dioxygenase family protein [Allokutzneria sp. NRRL B-24872]|uniref:cysteine dioxygenase n=1 Tax=Allokutzneria sp. NRRL B-24872 TaxID=1137961 RepID=UPI000A3A68BB|nr:cysteine dioxygenase family protein [Allokutzneria sp. NRRL B-24872]